jgi:hypothetical protein
VAAVNPRFNQPIPGLDLHPTSSGQVTVTFNRSTRRDLLLHLARVLTHAQEHEGIDVMAILDETAGTADERETPTTDEETPPWETRNQLAEQALDALEKVCDFPDWLLPAGEVAAAGEKLLVAADEAVRSSRYDAVGRARGDAA